MEHISEDQAAIARDWYFAHVNHVRALEAGTLFKVIPPQDILGSPEKWKGAHWKWFRLDVLPLVDKE